MNPEEVFALLNLLAERQTVILRQREALQAAGERDADAQQQMEALRKENSDLVSEVVGLKRSGGADHAAAS